MAKVKHTAEEIIEAIRGSSGIKVTIAKRLGVHRNTVDNYLKRYSTAQDAYDEEVETVGDIAESVIISAMIQEKDVNTAKWYAKTKLRNRGYVERQEFAGPDGGDIVLKVSGIKPDEV